MCLIDPFSIQSISQFNELALTLFKHQAQHNITYKNFLKHLNIAVDTVSDVEKIPFLPIEFFKTNKVLSSSSVADQVFKSSGTTGAGTSKHYVTDLSIYEKSYLKAFELFYGAITDYTVLALLPSYLEREGSSLIYMVNDLINKTGNPKSGFYLDDISSLSNTLLTLNKKGDKVLLIGVAFALLDLIEYCNFDLKTTVILETGGMKGRRKELIRKELHHKLKKGFGVDLIHSEYGMTELLSQAYSKGNGVFKSPPWMRVLIRDPEDPLSLIEGSRTGGINVIDLANCNSCSFIATQDLGKLNVDGSFEVLGRFDNSDIRGCNLLIN